MSNSAEEFYSENYKDDNLAHEFLEMRERFAEASGERIIDTG